MATRAQRRTQHKAIAMVLAQVAWKNGLDCIVVAGYTINRLFEVGQVRHARKDWFIEDVAYWFPYSEIYYLSDGGVASMFLSRCEIAKWLPPGSMEDEERIFKMTTGAPTVGILNIDWSNWRHEHGWIVKEALDPMRADYVMKTYFRVSKPSAKSPPTDTLDDRPGTLRLIKS